MTNRISDEELREIVKSALRGNRDSVTELLRCYTADMYFISRLYLEDKDEAKKSEQQALRKALQKLKESLNSDDITEWFQTIVREEALEQLKPVSTTEAFTAYYDTTDEYPTPEDVIAFSEDECQVRILKVLDRIDEPDRAAMALRFFDHMSVDEIADELSVTPDGARSLLVSGKSTLTKLNFPVSTLMALCERINPDTYKARAAVEDPVFEEPELPKEEPSFEIEAEEVPAEEEEPVLRRRRPYETASAAQPKETAEQPKQEPVLKETVVQEEETPVPQAPTPVEEPVITAEPAAAAVTEEPEMPVRKKKKSHTFLKSILAILLGAVAALGLYWYLFMNKPKPAVPAQSQQAVPAETQTENPEEKKEDTEETKQEETKPAEPEQQAEEPAADTGSKVGTAEVIVDEIRVRTGPGTGFDEAGEGVVYGEVFDVYDVSSDNDYMWYRIGDDMWIADYQGEWVNFTPAN